MSTIFKKRQMLGELLVEQGIITTFQLKEALKRQAQTGGHIGSILLEMGYISLENLLNFLTKQLGLPSVNLFDYNISPEILKILPIEKIKSMKVLPLNVDENTITLAMVNPRDLQSIRDIEFSLGKRVNPVIVPSSQMEIAIQNLFDHPEKGISGKEIEKSIKSEEYEKPLSLLSLLKQLSNFKATDMLLTPGVPPSIKSSNELRRLSNPPLTPGECERYAREIMTEKDFERFLKEGDKDLAITFPEIGRFRVNLYKQRNSISITIRKINEVIPTFEELNLPDWIKDYLLLPQGLILVAGPTGHGKTTTIAAMVDYINNNKRCNIVTLEDPIEYLHKHKKSNVNQREIGFDTKSFHEGLKYIFRQDPDVIVIGEMRDPDSFSIALQAADTGHLVITSVHSSSATSTIERIINMFPPHQQNMIRTRLTDNLLFVISQRLVPLLKGDGRILAYEKLINSHSTKNLIREGKTYQIKSQMLSGSEEFSPIEYSLAKLCNSGLISYDYGLFYSENKQYFKDLIKLHSGSGLES